MTTMNKIKLTDLTQSDMRMLCAACKKITEEHKPKTHAEKSLWSNAAMLYTRLVNKTLFLNKQFYTISIPAAEALAFAHFVIEANFFDAIGNEKYIIFELAGRIDKATV